MDREIRIAVPASTANLGPGFDALGAAMTLWLRLHASLPAAACDKPQPVPPVHVAIAYDQQGKSEPAQIDLDVATCLVTTVAAFVLASEQRWFPSGASADKPLEIRMTSEIPLSRGLGSSGAAVVAGVLLANLYGNLNLSVDDQLLYATIVEGHPDNVAASLLGGCVASLCDPAAMAPWRESWQRFQAEYPRCANESWWRSFSRSAVSQRANGGTIVWESARCSSVRIPWHPAICVLAVVPGYALSTAAARRVLPESVSRADAVFNVQRVAVLTAALGRAPETDSDRVCLYRALSDRLHQPFRQSLVPGLVEILSWQPGHFPGFIGAVLSGAGPTVLCLGTGDQTAVGNAASAILSIPDHPAMYHSLNVAVSGATGELFAKM